MRKRKAGKNIKLIKAEKCDSARIMVDFDDDLYEAMADAGKHHMAKDKLACFTYALNKALFELCEEIK